MQKPDDAVLIDQIQQGNIGAFRELVERYKRRIYYLAYDLSGNHHDAEDLSQEVFIKVYQSIHRYRAESSPYSWLYRITVNTFIDQKRKKILNIIKPWSTYKADSIPEPVERSAAGDSEKKTDSSFLQSHLQNALKKLSKRERTVFVLKHYHGLTISEIAATVDVAEGTVKSLLFRAIRKMQQALQFLRTEMETREAI
jgi:RNA polymerase sigma-70 factor (ECF subfamily)